MKNTHLSFKQLLTLAGLLFLSLIIAGCGFHLRSQNTQSPSITSVNLQASKRISKELENLVIQSLANKNIQVTEGSSYILKLDNASFEKKRIATSSDALTDRFTLRYRITGALLSRNKSRPINIYSDRIFDDNRVAPNSKNREQALITKELKTQVIHLLSNQLFKFN